MNLDFAAGPVGGVAPSPVVDSTELIRPGHEFVTLHLPDSYDERIFPGRVRRYGGMIILFFSSLLG